MNKKRTEQFIKWFGDSVKIDDCDPALYIINYFFDRFEFNLEQKYWLCWLYGTTYNFPTAYIIWNEFPDFHLVDSDRLKKWNDRNYERLRYQTDTKWNKGHLPEMFESYKKWVGNQSQHEKFQSLLDNRPLYNFGIMWKEANSWFKFGRYTAWFYLQTIKHCADVNIDATSLMLSDYEGSKSHRNGLCYAIGKDNLINLKLDDKQLTQFITSGEDILLTTKANYPSLANKIDYFAMETCLCSFKKLFRETRGRYLGYYLDRQAEEIKQAEKDGWDGINWEPLWQARNESIKEQYLNGFIDKEKMKLFLKENPMKKTKKMTIIGGMPVSGKTTLMNQIRKSLGKNYTLKESGLLRYEDYLNHVVLGIYKGDTFDGTDKLSMAVMKDAITFLQTNSKNVLVEGDRLFSKKFIDGANMLGYDVKILICTVSTLDEIVHRYNRRGQMQSSSFLKGRYTKLTNIQQHYPYELIKTDKPIPKSKIKLYYS